jgi:glycogen debranching enzyme
MARLLSAYDGASFIVLDAGGDIIEGCESGLYHEDTRFLSRHTLRLDGAAPVALSSQSPAAHLLVFFASNPALSGAPRGTLVIRRTYAVGSGLHCDLDVQSYAAAPVTLVLELAYDADFADVFEIKRLVEQSSPVAVEPAAAQALGRSILALAHTSAQGWSRRTEIRFSAPPVFSGRAARFQIALEPGGSFHACQEIFTIADGDFQPPRYHCSRAWSAELPSASPAPSATSPLGARPRLRSDDLVLAEAFAQSIEDLDALRIHRPEAAMDDFHLAAGVPWFMALFGRDSLIAAYQAMPFVPDLARGVLRSLARLAGKKDDPETEEQPGKILHEYRTPGLAGARGFVPRFPYYGSVDATPLFVVVLSEHARRTGDLAFVRSLEKPLLAAVRWIERAGDGFLTYRRSTACGLQNQGWKDSEDSVRFRDGRTAEPPIALVEVQGYVIDALRRAGQLYRLLGRPEAEAAALEARAERQVAAVDRAFWMEERGYYAMALDGAGARVDALTSNPAHLFWSGAALPERAARAAAVIASDDLSSGFGLRTMGRREAAFSPISYHDGSIWPHDTSLAAAGLARYGCAEEATRLTAALLDAVERYEPRRLPELFAGFSRAETPYPVEYPTSNAPQAWASGAVLLLVTTMLGLEIDALERRIRVQPALPARVGSIALAGLRVAGSEVAIEVRREASGVAVDVRGAPPGFRVDTRPRGSA